MLAVRDGELSAFDALFRRHYEAVRGLCARIIGAGDSGDDQAQETFLRVLRHRSTFRGDARFTTWVYRIARNVCLEQIARRARDRKLAERWGMEVGAALPEATDQLGDAELLAAAMSALSAEQREVLVLCRFHELPFAEVGEILGCTAGAARVRAHRALTDLRAAYASLSSGANARDRLATGSE
ncbi:MAG TPA: RNA polymerase sigma factor [Gemmatimonadaceae bacterium]|nr:RNA polymerase sigma factor [Gemmatimonadaceae bacterium]